MPAEVLSLEWRSALARRRLLYWNLAVPVLLLTPVALSAAAAPHRTAVYALFFVFFGAFGSAIPLIRDATSGWSEKVLLTGYGSRRWLLERLAASSGLDLLELIPACLVVLVAAGAGPVASLRLIGALAVALVFANLLGIDPGRDYHQGIGREEIEQGSTNPSISFISFIS